MWLERLFAAIDAIRARRLERRLREELAHHLTARTEQNAATGLPYDQARQAALRRIGDPDRAVRDGIDVLTGHRRPLRSCLIGLDHDVRDAGRVLVRRFGYALSIAAIVAMAVAGPTTVWSVADATVRRPLPTGVRVWLEWRHPIPHRALQIQTERVASADADALPADAVLAALLKSEPTLASTYDSLVGRAGTVAFASGPYYLVAEARDYATERAVRPVLDRIDAARLAQERASRWASIASPTTFAHVLLLDVSGTGDRAMQAYLEAVRRFHRTWREFFLPRLFEIAPLGVAEYQAMPTFQYRAPSAPLPGLLARVAGLTATAVVLCVVAGRRLRQQPE